MKRFCDGCRGSRGWGYEWTCDFGYKIFVSEKKIPGVGKVHTAHPAEDCPKPTTWKEWMNTPMKQTAKHTEAK